MVSDTGYTKGDKRYGKRDKTKHHATSKGLRPRRASALTWNRSASA